MDHNNMDDDLFALASAMDTNAREQLKIMGIVAQQAKKKMPHKHRYNRLDWMDHVKKLENSVGDFQK